TAIGVDVVPDRIDQEFGGVMPADADHAGAGEKRLPARDTAPHVDAGIFRRSFVWVKLFSGDRMNAFGAGHEVPTLRGQRFSIDVLEIGNGFRAIVIDTRTAPAGDHFVFASAFDKRVEQHHLQVATVNRKLRNIVTGKTSRWLTVDELAETVVETIFA